MFSSGRASFPDNPESHMQIELLSPQLIDVSSDAKKVSPDAIQALAESFQQI